MSRSDRHGHNGGHPFIPQVPLIQKKEVPQAVNVTAVCHAQYGSPNSPAIPAQEMITGVPNIQFVSVGGLSVREELASRSIAAAFATAANMTTEGIALEAVRIADAILAITRPAPAKPAEAPPAAEAGQGVVEQPTTEQPEPGNIDDPSKHL